MLKPFVAVVAFLIAPVVALAQPLGDRVPDNAILYIGWQGTEAMPPAYAQSHLKGILDSSNIRALFDQFLPQLMKKLGQQEPQVNEIWQLTSAIGGPLCRHPSAIYFMGMDFKNGGGPAPRVGIICQAANESDALFKQLQGLLEGPISAAPFPVKAFRIGDIVGFEAGYDEPAQAVAGNQAGQPKPITAAPKFQQVLNQAQKNSVAVLYVDVEAALGLATDAVKYQDDQTALAEWNKARDALGLDSVKRLVMTGGFDGKDWLWHCFISAPTPRKGVAALIGGATVSDAALKLVPVGATEMEASITDLASLMDAIRDIGGAFDPGFATVFDQTVAKINADLAMDLKKDLLSAFGKEWLDYSDPATTGAGTLGTVMLNKLANAAQAESSLTKLEGWINKKIAEEMKGEEVKIAITQNRIGNLDIHTLSVPLVAPSWAIRDGVFYLGFFPQTVVGAINGDKGKSILDNEKFTTLRQRLGTQNYNAISFVDLPRTAPAAYQVALPLTQLGLGIADMFGVKAPPMMMPPLDKLLENLAPTEAGFWTDDAGWHYKAITPFPGSKALASDSNLGVATTAMGVSILLPALNRAKAAARRVACASNLRQMSMAAIMYANDNNGQFPQDFAQMLPYVKEPRVFLCPATGRTVPAEVAAGAPEQKAKWVNENADYVYLGAKQRLEGPGQPATTILIYEKLENHRGEGINIAFADGHVEWLMMPQAKEMIEKQTGK